MIAQICFTSAMLLRSLRPPMLYFSATRPLRDNEMKRAGVILDIQPIAHVGAIAIDGQGLSFDGIKNGERYQLLREMVGTIIVRAV